MSIDGMPLNREKHADALTMLMQSGQESLFLIEYDVSVMGEHPHTLIHSFTYTLRVKYVAVSELSGDTTRGVTLMSTNQ